MKQVRDVLNKIIKQVTDEPDVHSARRLAVDDPTGRASKLKYPDTDIKVLANELKEKGE